MITCCRLDRKPEGAMKSRWIVEKTISSFLHGFSSEKRASLGFISIVSM